MMRVSVTVAILCFALTASARLHETVPECDSRYGQPTSFERAGRLHTRRYTKGTFKVILTFSDGRAVEVYYSRFDGKDLSEKEIKLFLHVNARMSYWEKVDQVDEWKRRVGEDAARAPLSTLANELASFFRWRRHDGRASAAYDRLARMLVVYDRRHLEAQRGKPREVLENPHGF